jgi:hypothetical protein
MGAARGKDDDPFYSGEIEEERRKKIKHDRNEQIEILFLTILPCSLCLLCCNKIEDPFLLCCSSKGPS